MSKKKKKPLKSNILEGTLRTFVLITLRENAGWSQSELAKRVGLNAASVCLWESGKTQPRGDKLKKLAKLFQVSISTLVAPKEQ